MSRPTQKQIDFFNSLVSRPEILERVKGKQQTIVGKARMKDCTFADMSAALSILRDIRDEIRREHGVEPMATPENSFTDRLHRYALALHAATEKYNICLTLVGVTNGSDLTDADTCNWCLHKHPVDSFGVTLDTCDVMPLSSAAFPWNDGSPKTCGCKEFVAPKVENVLAFHSVKAFRTARYDAVHAYEQVGLFMPGDTLVVNRGTKVEHGTTGVLIRQGQSEHGVWYLLRPKEGKDFFVSAKNCDRPDDARIPPMPEEITHGINIPGFDNDDF